MRSSAVAMVASSCESRNDGRDVLAVTVHRSPLMADSLVPLRDRGCIAQRVEAKSARRTVREISDQIVSKLRHKLLIDGGVITEAAEQDSFVRCVGPTAVTCAAEHSSFEGLRPRPYRHRGWGLRELHRASVNWAEARELARSSSEAPALTVSRDFKGTLLATFASRRLFCSPH